MKFVCKNCNYQFESTTRDEKNICPYCGKKEAVEPEKSASDLLSEVDNFE